MPTREKFINGVQVTVELTPDEVAEREAQEAADLAEAPRLEALAEINRLESEITQRRMREAYPDGAGGTKAGRDWMKNQMALIAVERAKL